MTLNFTLPPEKEDALYAVAQAQGISAEEWLQHLVEDRLQNTEPSLPKGPQRRPLSARIREIWAQLPDEVRAHLPIDGASEHDHYIYGTPKKEP